MHLTRGNHESHSMNRMYGFDGEVKAKYPGVMLDVFREVFNWLPLAYVLASKVLVLHGGLFSRDGVTLDDLRAVARNHEPPDEGLMCEALWSDPAPQAGRQASKRGVGLQFGPDVTKAFLDANGLELVVRSHEVKEEGYEVRLGAVCAVCAVCVVCVVCVFCVLVCALRGSCRSVRSSTQLDFRSRPSPPPPPIKKPGRARRAPHHRVLGAQLLRPDGKQGRVYSLRRRRHGAALYDL